MKELKIIALSAASIALIAASAHEMNAAYCRSIGDDSQLPWDDAPDWQKASAIMGVEFHIANPDADNAASHESWMAAKIADGWVFGEAKDEGKKTHPCIVSFDQLPAQQQFKDELFRLVVKGLITPYLAAQLVEQSFDEVVADHDTAMLQLKAQIADLTTKLDTAQKSASVTASRRSSGTRKIGPVGSSKAPILGGSALFQEIENAESVEIGFSDGKHEIAGLQPVAISGDAWRMSGDRVQLNVPELILHGPAHGVPAFKLAGYGLFLDGKLVAFSDRGGVHPIETGQRVNLKDDVIF